MLLMSDGAVVCSEELGSVLASRLANSWSKDSLVDLGISWPDSYFRPKHVAAVISVSRCPKDAIVMEGYGY